MAKTQAVGNILTIQQMAQATGLSTYTLRYYERAGLMQQVDRDEANGYRVYTWQHVDWVEFIKLLRATGMTIHDIQAYTELILQGEQTIPERRRLLKEHQSRIEAHLQQFEQYRAAVMKKIEHYEDRENQPGVCVEGRALLAGEKGDALSLSARSASATKPDHARANDDRQRRNWKGKDTSGTLEVG